MSPLTLTYRPQTATSQYGYALLLPDRQDPHYLPLDFTPEGFGLARNVTLVQPPYTESPLPRGDGKRKITPLVLTATTRRELFPTPTEDGVRLWLATLDALTRRATGLQRGQNIVRSLFPLGYATGGRPTDLFTWPLTLTLFPTGPDWIDQTTGDRSPF